MLNSQPILLLISDAKARAQLAEKILAPAGFEVIELASPGEIAGHIHEHLSNVLILENGRADQDIFELAASLMEDYPALGMIYFNKEHSESLAVKALRTGFSDYIYQPLQEERVLKAVRRAVQRNQKLNDWVHLQARLDTKELRRRVSDLEALQKIGQTVMSSLEPERVFTAVVDAAVELTGAEEGSLMLLDSASGELYMHAARNFQEDFVRTFRIPAKDNLFGRVLREGKPVLINDQQPKKIKTAYLVRALMYVPIILHGQPIGILGVDNRQSSHSFSEYDQALVSSLADFAAIAINNARFYSASEVERQKLQAILTGIKDGVIVVNQDRQVLLVNPTARQALNLPDETLAGKPILDILQNQDLANLIDHTDPVNLRRGEIHLDDGRVMNAQVTAIPEVGMVVTMQDITHLKKLDRIKTDFVNTVSHDLRSPLTAILGYAELISKIAPISPKQAEFLARIQTSVQSITALINDLLDLGRIEAGFDIGKEIVTLTNIVHFSLDGLEAFAAQKGQKISVEAPEEIPPVRGNPVRLQQMLTNLIHNAIQYTPPGGEIRIRLRLESDQVIAEITDNGPGIPPADQPYVFDKFYRVSNQPGSVNGTGLGLAIVKSIVEDHQGRVWVDSTLGQGTTFTVLLPITRDSQA